MTLSRFPETFKNTVAAGIRFTPPASRCMPCWAAIEPALAAFNGMQTASTATGSRAVDEREAASCASALTLITNR